MEQKKKEKKTEKTNPPPGGGGSGEGGQINDNGELLNNIDSLLKQAQRELDKKKKPLAGGDKGDSCYC